MKLRNLNKPLVVFVSSLYLVTFSSSTLSESGVDFVGGASLGYTRMEFHAKLDSEPTYPSYILSGTASFKKLYASLSIADSIRDETLSEEEDVGDAARTDRDLSIGYRVNKALSVFAGYKDSETDIDFQARDAILVRDEYYKQDGFFIGASYGFDFENRSSLSVSLAYVTLDTENRFIADVELGDNEDVDEESADEDDESDELKEFDDLQGRQRGDADGFSVGITWIMPLSSTLAFTTSYKINDYEEDIKKDGQTFSADTKVTLFAVGLLKVF